MKTDYWECDSCGQALKADIRWDELTPKGWVWGQLEWSDRGGAIRIHLCPCCRDERSRMKAYLQANERTFRDPKP